MPSQPSLQIPAHRLSSSHSPNTKALIPIKKLETSFSSARRTPLAQAEALKREVNALKSVLRMRGPHGQGEEIPPPGQSTIGELELPDPSLAASSAGEG